MILVKRGTLAVMLVIAAALGVAVLSTSKGILSDRKAREAAVGGELVCEVW